MNLAVGDFLQLAKMPLFIYNSFMQGPALGYLGESVKWPGNNQLLNWNISIGCQIYGFVGGLGGVSSIMSLAAVAVDRYLVISRPLSINRKTTRTQAVLIIAFIWMYSATFSALPLMGIGRYVPEGYLTSCSFDYLSDDSTTRIFILIFFLAAWLVPFTVIASCYAAIIQSVGSSRKSLTIDQHNSHVHTHDDSKTSKLDVYIYSIAEKVIASKSINFVIKQRSCHFPDPVKRIGCSRN